MRSCAELQDKCSKTCGCGSEMSFEHCKQCALLTVLVQVSISGT